MLRLTVTSTHAYRPLKMSIKRRWMLLIKRLRI